MREPSQAASVPTETLRRGPAGRSPSPLTTIGLLLFAVGLLAVVAIMVLFAMGWHDLPLWLNLSAMLAPVGFGVGLLGLFIQARSDRRSRASSAPSRSGDPR